LSADNGIYIVKFPDGYRVAHAQAIDNIDYFPEGTEERKEQLKAYFGGSKVYKTKGKAVIQAFKIEEETAFLEYGVRFLGKREAFE
jgi:hypothetical protein